ncbi:hypothetical protein K437DRAFT_18144 [Tilletiaria anomala UBC 951]|uniref:Uncharacterized protein n=1 Tax=Tilletiaria anomala (strain ATCC 24038 / CBS 436.72 / UBC 951) TaxID=1037660 RepID=A0A066WF56_TILAU|nr:uncharacterized protein K437DRAFT_18144 [Tilletiaria anomala UBC 951]KDN52386.1 hypothetical protein K437DRAFT_18144 [Tilletiaria anomala UBC 951]
MLAAAAELVPALRSEYAAQHSRRVEDADEEIFLLYSLSRPDPGRRGLGHVEIWSDLLRVTVKLRDIEPYHQQDDSAIAPGVSVEPVDAAEADPVARRSKVSTQKTGKGKKDVKAKQGGPSHVEAYIWQSQTSLRSQRGNTGSVMWRSSILLGATMVRQHVNKAPLVNASGDPVPSLLDWTCNGASRDLCVLELGAGTGVLSAILHSSTIFKAGQGTVTWVATDQEALLLLLRKNINFVCDASLQTSPQAMALDWTQVRDAVQLTKRQPSALRTVLRDIHAPFGKHSLQDDLPFRPADIVVAVDCIFNPSLFPAFLDTLTALCHPEFTVVFVLVELREQAMMHDFLSAWVEHRHPTQESAQWAIWSIEGSALGLEGLQKGYACFVAYLTLT